MFVVCGDDGHGLTRKGVFHPTSGKRTPPFSDGTVIYENEINRMCCKAFLAAVKRCGMKPVEAAPGDEDVSLAERAKRARESNADVFVSFHYNAGAEYAWGEGKQGVSVHIHSQHTSKQSEKLAEQILEQLVQVRAPRKNRGIGRSAFYVVNEKNTRCPAVLIEAGFMDNPREAGWMRDEGFAKEVGEAACQGVCAFLDVGYVQEKHGAMETEDTKAENPIGQVQQALGQRGFDPTWIDGIWGAKTAQAAVDAQKTYYAQLYRVKPDETELNSLIGKLGTLGNKG